MGDERSRVIWGMMGALMDVAFVSGGIQWDLGSLMEINSLNRLGDSLGDPRFPCTARCSHPTAYNFDPSQRGVQPASPA